MDDRYVCMIDGAAVVLGRLTPSRYCAMRSFRQWADAGMPPIRRGSGIYYIEGYPTGARFRRSTGLLYIVEERALFEPPPCGKVTIAQWDGPVADVVARARCEA